MKKLDLSKFEGKDVSDLFSYANELSTQSLEDKLNAHLICNTCLDMIPRINKYPYNFLRGKIRRKIWHIERDFNWNKKYFSHAGQDRFIDEFLVNNKEKGYFIEIGAYDGIKGSNCYYFEKKLKWSGIAVEPSSFQFKKLLNNRSCKCINKVISNKTNVVEFVEVYEGLTEMSGINSKEYNSTSDLLLKDKKSKFNKIELESIIFNELEAQKEIDYLSIDVEGEEKRILESINFSDYMIKVISVENNNQQDINYSNILYKNNFEYFDTFGFDEIYYSKFYSNLG